MKVLLIPPDNGSYISRFPLGIGYIAAVLRNKGHYVEIYSKDVYHYPEEHLANFLIKNDFDVVGTGTCGGYYQYREMKSIASAVRKSRGGGGDKDFVFIGGGHLVTPEPEYFLKLMGYDFVVLGEGEETMCDLLDHLENHKSVSDVLGIAYFDENKKFCQNPRRPEIENLDSLPFPAWDLFPIDHYALCRLPNMKESERSMVMYSGRGCLFHCNFCYRMNKGLRARSSENVIAEMQELKEKYRIDYIGFFDELLMNSPERIEDFCTKLIKAKLNMHWDCNGRLNFAKPNVLKLMKEAGCVFINYGIESLDEKALKTMNKNLTVKQITEGIENTLAAGISPGYNIIFGNIGETEESLRLGVEFLLKYDDHAQLRTIRPVTPYPGCPLYYYAIEKGMLDGVEDFYENKHVNSDLLTVNFTDMNDEEFYRVLRNANERLLDNYYDALKKRAISTEHDLYDNKNVNFRGFRPT